jgi:hypothetical protein
MSTPANPQAAADRSPYQQAKGTIADVVAGARDGWQEGAPPTSPPEPPAPSAPPATPAAPAGTAPVTFTTEGGEKFAVSWKDGTLTIAQGTEVLAIPTQELIPQRAVERHIDTVAVELERVSEGQRYFTKLLEAREGAAVPPRQG